MILAFCLFNLVFMTYVACNVERISVQLLIAAGVGAAELLIAVGVSS